MSIRTAIWFLSLALWSPAISARAANPESVEFSRGNAHFQSGDFAAAELCYRQILERGLESGALYYNLGNACFKQKKIGEAIYFWEKANRLSPGDTDVTENLRFANLLVVDRIEVPDDPLPVRLLSAAVRFFTVREESIAGLLLFVGANALLALYLLTFRPRLAYWALTGCIVLSMLTLLVAASVAWKVYQEDHNREGVVVVQKVEIRSGPGAENVTVATVHEGIMVRVGTESAGWCQVILPNGWTGWVPSSAIRIL